MKNEQFYDIIYLKGGEAIIGAQAVAAAIYLARNGADKERIKTYLEKTFKYRLSTPLSTIKETHVFDSRTSYSVPPAIIAFLESTDYESAIRNAISLGGDADTQACIAGGIAEAYYKEIPEHIKRFCDGRIDFSIKSVVQEFAKQYCTEKVGLLFAFAFIFELLSRLRQQKTHFCLPTKVRF